MQKIYQTLLIICTCLFTGIFLALIGWSNTHKELLRERELYSKEIRLLEKKVQEYEGQDKRLLIVLTDDQILDLKKRFSEKH